MDRLHYAAALFNDNDLINQCATKFETKKALLKAPPAVWRPDPEPPEVFVGERSIQRKAPIFHGKKRPQTFKAAPRRYSPPETNVDVVTVKKRRNVPPCSAKMRYLYRKTTPKTDMFSTDDREENVAGALEGMQPERRATEVNRVAPNIIRVTRMHEPPPRERLRPTVEVDGVVRFYARDLFDEVPEKVVKSGIRAPKASPQRQKPVGGRLHEDSAAEENQTAQDTPSDILSRELSARLSSVMLTLQAKLRLRAATLEREVRAVRGTLRHRKDARLDQAHDLSRRIDALNRAVTQRKIEELDAQAPSAQECAGLHVDTSLLTNLENYTFLLSASSALWIEEGSLGCEGCMTYAGLREGELRENIRQLMASEDSELQSTSEQVRAQLKQLQCQSSATLRAIEDIEIEEDEDSSTQWPHTTNYETIVLPKAQDGAAQDGNRRNISTPTQGRKRTEQPPQQFDKAEERYIVFPCGDSICRRCLQKLEGHCPVCYGPVQRTIRAKEAVFNGYFIQEMIECENSLRRMAELLGRLLSE